MSTLQIEVNSNSAKLIGSLARKAIANLDKKAHAKIVKNSEVTLDLSQINEVDTSGLAWLLFLLEQANLNNCQLSFAHLPADLLKLAELSAVKEFLSPAS